MLKIEKIVQPEEIQLTENDTVQEKDYGIYRSYKYQACTGWKAMCSLLCIADFV